MSIEDLHRRREGMRPRRVFGRGETPPELAAMLVAELERRVTEPAIEDKESLVTSANCAFCDDETFTKAQE
jgi:hypothetical protein